MARKLFLTLVLVILAITIMYAYISEITNITNENHYKELELYSYSIINYQNRLITQNNGSIHEYLIQDDGSLLRIAYFDKKQSVIAYIDGDRYYDVESLEGMSGLRINVYDLLYTPMQKINSFEVLFISNWQRVYISQNHFLFYDQPNFRYILINKQNYEVDGYLSLPYTLKTVSGDLVVMQGRSSN